MSVAFNLREDLTGISGCLFSNFCSVCMSGLRLIHYQVYGRLHKHVEHFAPSQNTEELCSCAITQPKIKLLFHFARTSPSRQVVSEPLDGLQNVAELLQIYFLFYCGEGEAPIPRKHVVSASPFIKQCGSPIFSVAACSNDAIL
jgi:hypothetical protein